MNESTDRVKITPEINRALRDVVFTDEEMVLIRLSVWGFSLREIARRMAWHDPCAGLGVLYPQILSNRFTPQQLAIMDAVNETLGYQQIADEFNESLHTIKRCAKEAAEQVRAARSTWPRGTKIQERRSGWIRWALQIGFAALCGSHESRINDDVPAPYRGPRDWLSVLGASNGGGPVLWKMDWPDILAAEYEWVDDNTYRIVT